MSSFRFEAAGRRVQVASRLGIKVCRSIGVQYWVPRKLSLPNADGLSTSCALGKQFRSSWALLCQLRVSCQAETRTDLQLPRRGSGRAG